LQVNDGLIQKQRHNHPCEDLENNGRNRPHHRASHEAGLAWFSDPALALPTLIAINVRRGAPFAMVMLLAGLQTVPRELLEAARRRSEQPTAILPCYFTPPTSDSFECRASFCTV
jgi:ABC-type sugar transport system permease subunit